MHTWMALASDTYGEAAPARYIRARNAGYPPPALKTASCYWWALAYAQQERASCPCLPCKRGAMHHHWWCAAVTADLCCTVLVPHQSHVESHHHQELPTLEENRDCFAAPVHQIPEKGAWEPQCSRKNICNRGRLFKEMRRQATVEPFNSERKQGRTSYPEIRT